MSKTAITSPELAPPVGPFSQAVEVGGFLYFSGPAQSPGISLPCSLGAVGCQLGLWIDRPGNGQDLPLPINFAHLPDFET